MSPRVRAFLGWVTTAVFVAIGASLYTEGQRGLGAILVVLGLLRGSVAVRQLWDAVAPDGSDAD